MKVKLENTREHDLTLSVQDAKNGITTVTIPAARQDKDDKTKLVHGVGEVEDSFLGAAKKSPVVQHYFDEGWLRPARSGNAKQQTKDDE